MALSKQQMFVFDAYKNNKNIFITGPGGSGKSTLIKSIYDDAINCKKKIQLTALTGVAALQLSSEAKTLHSWAGIGLGNTSVHNLISKIEKSKVFKDNWNKIDILVIDEISMLSEKLFNSLNIIAKSIRKNDKNFGGIQIICSGDFFQLPPIGKTIEENNFCFESKYFNEIFDIKVHLNVIFRQNDDNFKKLLNNIRIGKITKENIDVLNNRVNISLTDNIKPVVLMPKKVSVDQINSIELSKIEGDQVIFKREIVESPVLTKEEEKYVSLLSSEEKIQELHFLENSSLVEKEIKLKVGAQVMSIINVIDKDRIIVSNGTRGIVKCFINGSPFVEFENDVKMLITNHLWKCHSLPSHSISQIPLILAWALTIHKSQGSTIQCCKMNIGNDIFEAGQTYVALSRVKNIEGLYLDAFNPYKIKINSKLKKFYDTTNFDS